MLSPTQVLAGQVQNLNNNKKQQKKKQKCHGNRKEQHKRRRLRCQQQKAAHNANDMEQSVIVLEDDNVDVEGDQQEQIQVCLELISKK